ncbi:hopanoid-associated phosphorylase [Roseomonas sp. E05]|uniref:phosphorylase family protein n=1 Tax=Roseomonas sp. E05 TaxID=3046310 RepID=UPI0024BBC164|nr:hopanoid-associated phosphorylase [Roseomonas sp. E05]MDJ0391093.1 hopanoid-associated phosphorylase [Roseomonas sp. E05]
MRVLVATGLRREARILAGPEIEAVAGGGDAGRLEAALERLAGEGACGLISIGIAGALAPGLHPGDWLVASAVLDGEAVLLTDPAWTARLAARLSARQGTFLGSDAVVAGAAEKVALHARTGAAAVDMESHIAARVARRHGLPFAAARVISDAADRSLPPAARVGMRPDGGMDLAGVLRALAARPGQLPALIRTGWEAERAFRALLRGHRLLGSRLGAVDLGELPLDMA